MYPISISSGYPSLSSCALVYSLDILSLSYILSLFSCYPLSIFFPSSRYSLALRLYPLAPWSILSLCSIATYRLYHHISVKCMSYRLVIFYCSISFLYPFVIYCLSYRYPLYTLTILYPLAIRLYPLAPWSILVISSRYPLLQRIICTIISLSSVRVCFVADLVVSAGGKVHATLPKSAAADKPYVVSCPEDVGEYRPLLARGYSVLDKECILSAILRQRLEPDQFLLT